MYGAWARAGCLAGCALQTGITSAPKAGEEAHYSSTRPISVLSAMCKLYSAARLRKTPCPRQEQVIQHLPAEAGVADLPIADRRLERGCRELVIPLACSIEHAALEGTTQCGVLYDLAKAFDSLPAEVRTNTGGEG